MMPEQVLSSTLIFALTEVADPQPSALIAKELGGIALNNPNEGLRVKVWTAEVIPGDPLDSINVYADDVSPVTIVIAPDITQVSLAFDQNMQPSLAYVSEGSAKHYWFDSAVPGFVTTDYGPGVTTPRITLDDHRDMELNTSDIILVYIEDGNLNFRAQRDRFLIEYALYPDINLDVVNPKVHSVCMNQQLRLQIEVRGFFYGG